MKILDVGNLNTVNQPTDLAQLPIKAGTLLFLQQAYQEGFSALILGLLGSLYRPGDYFILYGCVNTGSYPTYNISGGAVFYNPYPNWGGGSYAQGAFVTYQGAIYVSKINGNTDTPPSTNWQVYSTIAGEVFLVPPAQFTATGSQVAVFNLSTTSYTGITAPVTLKADPVTFTDGSTHYVHTSRIMTITAGDYGSGAFNYPNGYTSSFAIYDSVYAEESRAMTQENILGACLPPIGGIMMYYNANSNWSTTYFDGTGKGVAWYGMQNYALCNGQNGTPDLRGMFIAGFDERTTANGGDSDYTTLGNSGGFKFNTLSPGNIPAHRHGYSWFSLEDSATWNNWGPPSNDSPGFSGMNKGTYGVRGQNPMDHNVGGAGNGNDVWAYSNNTGDGTDNNGGQDTLPSSPAHLDNRPPYYTLAYIMRISG